MGRSKQKVQRGFVLFDVFYEDGTRTSNRKARVQRARAAGLGNSRRAGDGPRNLTMQNQCDRANSGMTELHAEGWGSA
jgi:hypothetical protein